MPRLKSFATMLANEKDQALDEMRGTLARVERLVQGGAAKKPAAKKVQAAAAPKKPGPKKGYKKKAAAQAKKPGPKPKAASSKTVKAAVTKGATKRRSLIEDIQTVIAGNTMNAVQVHVELKKRHWLPNSDDPLGYIRYTLSKEKTIFLRIEGQRGFYHLKGSKANAGAKVTKPTPKAAPSVPKSATVVAAPPSSAAVIPQAEESKPAEAPKVVAAPPPPPPPVASKPAGEDEDPSAVADEILKGAGIDMAGANPFPGQ